MKIIISPKFVHRTAPLGTAEQIISVEGKQQLVSALTAYRKQMISRSLSRKKGILIKVFVRDIKEASSLDATNFFLGLFFLFCPAIFFRVLRPFVPLVPCPILWLYKETLICEVLCRGTLPVKR